MNISLYVISISELNESPSGSFRAQMYLRQKWRDNRFNGLESFLKKDPSLSGISKNNKLHLRKEQVQQIWTPDTFVPNVRSLHHHPLIISGKDAEFCIVDLATKEVFISKMY